MHIRTLKSIVYPHIYVGIALKALLAYLSLFSNKIVLYMKSMNLYFDSGNKCFIGCTIRPKILPHPVTFKYVLCTIKRSF